MGHAKARYCLFGLYEHLREIRTVCSMSQDKPFTWKSCLDDPGSLVGQGLRESPRQSKNVSQISGDSDIVATCVCTQGGRELNQKTMASTSFSVWEITAPPALTMKPVNSVPPCMKPVNSVPPWCLSSRCPSTGAQSK